MTAGFGKIPTAYMRSERLSYRSVQLVAEASIPSLAAHLLFHRPAPTKASGLTYKITIAGSITEKKYA